MNYLVLGEVVEDHGTLLGDALADGCRRVVVRDCWWRGELGNLACV